jgi:hypothetical protein
MDNFTFTEFFQPHSVPGVNSAPETNTYQGSFWGKGQPVHEADILSAICEPTDCLENVGASTSHTLWVSTAYYRDRFTSFCISLIYVNSC